MNGRPSDSGAKDILPVAFDILSRWETEPLSLDDLLDDVRGTLQPRLRAGVTSLLLTYFRHLGAITAMSDSLGMKLKPRLWRAVRLATAQLHYQQGIPSHAVVNYAVEYAKRRFGKIPANAINATLRKVCDLNPSDFPDTLPPALSKRWRMQFDDTQVQALTKELAEPPAFTFRRVGRSIEFPFDSTPITVSELPGDLFFMVTRPRDLFASKIIDTGSIYIQDPSTFLFVKLLYDHGIKHVTKILDACCAPGGKSLLAAEFLNPETVVCADRSAERQKRTSENIARCKTHFPSTTFDVVVADASVPFPQTFGLVMLDVPCSNTGVLKRRPDAAWRFEERKITELVQLQATILDAQAAAVEPGGYLIYSTCSLEIEENAGQIRDFLLRHSEFLLAGDEQWFPTAYRDGGYAALLQRIKAKGDTGGDR